MIPMTLRMQNFMSYAELDLDFRGIHCAVLSGPNGAGKSSLLDAITYALWDRARSGAENMIRLGQSEMWVELIFGLDDQTYRIWRRRMRKSGAQSQLEFQQLGADETYVSLTGTTIRETQARINATVRMDYETFTNSAFILQGKADQFTTKTPRERKALLGDILGLQSYDDLSQKARDRWKASQLRADSLEAEQQELREQLAAREALTADREGVREALGSLGLFLSQAQSRQSRLIAEEQGLKSAQAQIDALNQAKAQAETEHARLSTDMAAHAADIRQARDQADQREAIEAAHTEFLAMQVEEQTHRKRADAHHAAERAVGEAKREEQAIAHRHELAVRSAETELSALRKERGQHMELAKDKERIEQAFAALSAARVAEAAHMEGAQAYRRLEQRRQTLDQAIQLLNLRHQADQKERQERLARARRDAAALPALLIEIRMVQSQLDELAIVAVDHERVRERGFQYKARKEQALAAIDAAQARIRGLGTKIAQLQVHEGAAVGGGPDARSEQPHHDCPLCRTPLGEAELAAICEQYEAEVQGLEDDILRLEHEIVSFDKELVETRTRYATLTDKLKQREPGQQRLGELTTRQAVLEEAQQLADELSAALADAEEPALPPALAEEEQALKAALAEMSHDPAELPVLQARIADQRWSESRHWQLEQALVALEKVEARLPALEAELAELMAAAESEAERWQGVLAALEAELAAIGHDAAAHRQVQHRLSELEQAPARYNELQKRLLWLESAAALLARLEAEKAQQALRAAEIALELATLDRQVERLPQWETELASADAELRRLREEERQRHEELGRLDSQLARLDALGDRLAARDKAWETAIEEAQTYKELHVAFGKNGIQALIIENALPELEEEANRVLARISDNRMHVRLATQKEKKSGGVNETLEIFISDEVGTRNYELYSGGEAFRVNFALRLALSRLLARRAGTRLQTLVIDEGFGTQDDKGRERLVEAINAVSSEFERILVITHIRELKDAFNTHIEVSKRGGLSEVKLSA